ncbi:MAG TPA: hypothetical protein VD902_07515 [Symbiobacteriaceae bacterium]|nr:hypothetical protein [Symbiobacteriaceae bacterium]
MPDIEAIRRFGVEPDFETYTYDPNACSFCGQPVLVIQTKEREKAYRSARESCAYCMQRLSKRTRAKGIRWVFLQGWKPES